MRLVDDLLEISRITSGKIELRKQRVDIAEVVRLAVETSRPLIEAAGHELRVALPVDPPVIDVDPVRISQVLANLLNNSSKYAEAGGEIHLGVRREPGAVAISVRDRGLGIPPDMLSRVFDMFIQIHRDPRLSSGGLGIGLALAKRLVEMHGGTIEARSSAGEGSEFIVRIPVNGEASSTEEPQRPGAEADDPPSSLRILVVDDNQDSAVSLAGLLRLMGNDVQVEHDGESALATFARFHPSVVFLDLGMPGMNGFEVAGRIRRDPGGLGVTLAALTGRGREEDGARTKAAGFNAHFVKPIEVGDLDQLLRSLPAPNPEQPGPEVV